MSRVSYELSRCIVCGQADATIIAEREDIEREVEALWAFHERRLLPGTPIPRLADRLTFSQLPPLRVVQCTECGLVYRRPAEGRAAVAAIYADAQADASLLRALHERQLPTYRALARRLHGMLGRRSGSVLEVGSYVGGFLAAAREIGLSADGLDINPAINQFSRGLGFQVTDGDITIFESDHQVDGVAIWNTFDQLADPRGALRRAWMLLKPGGVIAIRVANGAFYARLRAQAIGSSGPSSAIARLLLAENNLLGFPYRFGFTPHSLAGLLRYVGFEPIGENAHVLVPLADEWTRPWARAEERALKAVLGWVATRNLSWAPWFESYARRPAKRTVRGGRASPTRNRAAIAG